MGSLKDCCDNLKGLLGKEMEPCDIISTVDAYRKYWKPGKIKVILLAESHVHTTMADYRCKLCLNGLDLPLYPTSYVRFVYCLGYGENALLDNKPENNYGTPDFWKIFFSTCNPIGSHSDFHPILKKTTSLEARIANKIKLLNEMRDKGIWLLDASIIGIDKHHKPASELYQQILSVCWDKYLGNIIEESAPSHVICIGKGVNNTLGEKIKKATGQYPVTVPLPGSFLSTDQKLHVFQKIHDVCVQYQNPNQKIHVDTHIAAPSSSKKLNGSVAPPENWHKTTIKKAAMKWFHDKHGTVTEPVYCSKYYPAKESFTKAPSWAHAVPKSMRPAGSSTYVHLLCQKANGVDDYHYLRIPTSYLLEKEPFLYVKNGKVSIFLSPEKDKFMQDQRGKGKVDFSQFIVDGN